MSHLSRMMDLLPPPYAIAPDSIVSSVLDHVAIEMDAFQEDLDRYQRSHWINAVYAVGDAFAGAGNVTSIAEYPEPVTSPAKSDTLHFQFLPSGDIYQYGFIAGVVARREGVHLVPSWDRIAALSLPTNGTWAVGTADPGGTDSLRGTVLGDQGYFIASLNGVRTVFHGYGVSLSSLDIDYTIVVSDVPPAVLFIQELSTPIATGFLRSLATLTKH